jgi:hypothetical protein
MRPEILFPLFAPITSLKGVGPRIAPALERIAGHEAGDSPSEKGAWSIKNIAKTREPAGSGVGEAAKKPLLLFLWHQVRNIRLAAAWIKRIVIPENLLVQQSFRIIEVK